jgi:ATP-dependent Lon protease
MSEPAWSLDDLTEVPLFPLPNVVLLPRAVLPLHIFEPRYREMMRYALKGSRVIGMALLDGDWKHRYHGCPSICDVICVGRIVTHEQLDDGRFNLLLEGRLRGRIVEEDRSLSFRRAKVEPIAETRIFEVDIEDERRRLGAICARPKLAGTSLALQLSKLVTMPIRTSEVADVMAFSLIDDVIFKQRLLCEGDVIARVRRVADELDRLFPDAMSLDVRASLN